MGTALQNRDTATSEQAVPLFGSVIYSRPLLGLPVLYITTAGNSKKGKVILILSRQK
jgi:hypothetical protein